MNNDRLKQCPNSNWFLFDRVANRLIPGNCRSKDCPFCRRIMAKRYSKQIKAESREFRRVRIAAESWESYRKQLQRQKKRYKAFPQKSGILEVIADVEQGEPLAMDEDKLLDLLDDLLANKDRNKRVSGSQGFGGKYAGSRAVSEKGRYRRFGSDIQDAVDELSRVAQDKHTKAEELQSSLSTPGENGVIHLKAILQQEVEQHLERIENTDIVAVVTGTFSLPDTPQMSQ